MISRKFEPQSVELLLPSTKDDAFYNISPNILHFRISISVGKIVLIKRIHFNDARCGGTISFQKKYLFYSAEKLF